jgi:hypothetical protein
MPKPKIVPGMMCAYCAVEPATEVEHIFPLRLIPKDERDQAKRGLIYAPACGACNDRKRVTEETLAHALIGDTGDRDEHRSAMKLMLGPIANAVRFNNSRVGAVLGDQLDSAPVLWLPSAKGWEQMTFFTLTDELAGERLETVRFMAKGLINDAYGIIVPPGAVISVRSANYLQRERVIKLLAGRIPLDQRLSGSLGEGIADWVGAAAYSQPDLSDLHAFIGIDFYRRSFYVVKIAPA